MLNGTLKVIPRLLLSFSLVAVMSACVKPGDFCDTARPIILTDAAAKVVAVNDPAEAQRIVAHNLYGIENCHADWWPL